MKKCEDCVDFVHNPPIFGNKDGKCERDGMQHREDQECCVYFKEREKNKQYLKDAKDIIF